MNRIIYIGVGFFIMYGLFTTSLASADAPPNSRALDEVDRLYAAKITAIDKDYHVKIIAMRKQQLDALQALLEHAMKKNNIDQAIVLHNKILAVQAALNSKIPILADTKDTVEQWKPLESAIKGAKWEWGLGQTIQFNADGTVSNDNWTGQGLTTTWKIIDQRTVLLYIQRGRNDNRYELLSFSPNLGRYTAFNFDGNALVGTYQQKH